MRLFWDISLSKLSTKIAKILSLTVTSPASRLATPYWPSTKANFAFANSSLLSWVTPQPNLSASSRNCRAGAPWLRRISLSLNSIQFSASRPQLLFGDRLAWSIRALTAKKSEQSQVNWSYVENIWRPYISKTCNELWKVPTEVLQNTVESRPIFGALSSKIWNNNEIILRFYTDWQCVLWKNRWKGVYAWSVDDMYDSTMEICQILRNFNQDHGSEKFN